MPLELHGRGFGTHNATVAFTLDTYSADVEDLNRDAVEAVIGLFLPPSAKGLI